MVPPLFCLCSASPYIFLIFPFSILQHTGPEQSRKQAGALRRPLVWGLTVSFDQELSFAEGAGVGEVVPSVPSVSPGSGVGEVSGGTVG